MSVLNVMSFESESMFWIKINYLGDILKFNFQRNDINTNPIPLK
jgi:hypothetical protein